MQQKPFRWIGSIGAIAALLGVAWISLTVAELDPPGHRPATLRGSDRASGARGERATGGLLRGSRDAQLAGSEARPLAMSRPEVRLSPSAAALARAAQAVRRDFERSARQADLPDERGPLDAEFLERSELVAIEESLELSEFEQALVGAERSASMHARLQAALQARQ